MRDMVAGLASSREETRYNLEQCLTCSQRAHATRQQQVRLHMRESHSQPRAAPCVPARCRRQRISRKCSAQGGSSSKMDLRLQAPSAARSSPRKSGPNLPGAHSVACARSPLSDLSMHASGAKGTYHDHSLGLNVAVTVVEAPPAKPSVQPGPSGLTAGAPSETRGVDEPGHDFRRGQRVVRALLDETEAEHETKACLPAMPPTPGALQVKEARHRLGRRPARAAAALKGPPHAARTRGLPMRARHAAVGGPGLLSAPWPAPHAAAPRAAVPPNGQGRPCERETVSPQPPR